MKKSLLLLAFAALLLVGCAKEQIAKKNVGDGLQTVSFTVDVKSTATKAVLDGDGAAANINHWIMQVLDSDGEVYNYQEEDGEIGVKTHTFNVTLIKGQTYDVLFWADTKGKYVVTDLCNVKRTDGLKANSDSLDAFSAVVEDFSTAVATQKQVTLKRPFAQLNVVFTDLKKLYTTMGKNDTEYTKFRPMNFVAKAKVPTSFNVFTQETGAPSETPIEVKADTSYSHNYTAHGDKETLYMDYIFASAGNKDIVDIDFSFTSRGVEISHNFTAIPFQCNYRTNILGEFMSAGAQWNVTVDPIWDSKQDGSDDYNIVYYQASSIEAANSYIGTQNEEQTKTVDLTNAEVKQSDVASDGTIHFILKTTSPKDEVSFMLPEIPSELAEGGCTGWTIEYESGYPTKNVNVSAPANTNVIILAPTSHVLLNGEVYKNVEALTGYGTLVIPQGVTVQLLTVKKGNVEIHGTIDAIQILPTVGESIFFCACEGLSQTVFEQIKGEDFSYIHPSYVAKQNGDKWDIILSENPGDGSRKISLADSPFKAGDVIKISNGVAAPEDCTVEEDEQGNILIKTNLMGSLTAIYPASAAKLNGNAIEGINIPATQSGKLADAKIYKASISAGGSKAVFESQAAVLKFYVDATIGVKSVSIASDKDLASNNVKTVTVDPTGETTIDKVTDDTAKRICYVAVLPGEKTSLTYSSVTTTQGNVTRTLKASETLVAGQEYEAFIPYYIDLGTAGLWGYCNVGAFLPEEYGKYFDWADVAGQSWNGSSWSNGGFSTTPAFDGKQGTLAPEKDAASIVWGDKWIMPTEEQLNALTALEDDVVWDGTKKGYVVSGKMFLPAAGSGNGSKLDGLGEVGLFRSSSYSQFKSSQQQLTGYYSLMFNTDYYIMGAYSASPSGGSVRPVKATALTGIALNKTEIKDLEVAEKDTLVCTLTPAYASIKSITWASDKNSVVTVSDSGEVTGVAAGTATVTVTVTDMYNTQKTATCSVTVKEPYHPVTSVALDLTSVTLIKGKTKTLSPTIYPENATNTSVTWSSNTTSVATVSTDGVVTAVAVGSAIITVTTTDGSKTATCSVTVKELPAGALSGAFSVSDTKQVYFAKGNLWYASNTKTFSFEDTQYASQPTLNKNHQDVFRHATKIDEATTILTENELKISANVNDFNKVSGNILFTNSSPAVANANFTVGGVKGKYRALSKDEWTYLLARSGKLKKWVKIDNQYVGFVIAPDDYTGTIEYNYTLDQWSAAEKAGLVFIAHANYYDGAVQYNWQTGIIAYVNFRFDHNDGALYWGSDLSRMSYYAESSAYYTDAPEMYVISEEVYITGAPIRLVTEL